MDYSFKIVTNNNEENNTIEQKVKLSRKKSIKIKIVENNVITFL